MCLPFIFPAIQLPVPQRKATWSSLHIHRWPEIGHVKGSSVWKVQQAEEQEAPRGWHQSFFYWQYKVSSKSPTEDLKEEVFPTFHFPLTVCIFFLQLHFCPTAHGSYLGAHSQPASSERSCTQQIALASPQITSTRRELPRKDRSTSFSKITNSDNQRKEK